jgi:hypothetical protein
MVTAQQAYEWVKTGHWNKAQFIQWLNEFVNVSKA